LSDWLFETIDSLRHEYADVDVTAIGLAVAGTVSRDGGGIERSVNLDYLEGDWLPARLEEHARCPVMVHTDIDAAAWAECQVLEEHAIDRARVAHLRLGSGVGLGIVDRGKQLPIEPGRRTHPRVLVVDEREDGPVCPCGLRGCLELFVRSAALTKAAASIGVEPDLAALQQAVEDGYVPAVTFVDAVAEPIVLGIEKVARSYKVDIVVLGGGVLEHLPALSACVRYHVQRVGARQGASWPVAVEARLGDDAGVIGAARLAMKNARNTRSLRDRR
jgi:glucokinase